jgi:thiol-disulfide isomerase/thioredoxin
MKQLFTTILLAASMTTFAQKPGYSISKDTTTGQLIFNGQITFDDLNNEKSFDWLKSGEDEYQPDATQLAYLKQYLPQYQLVVFMGTWCDDSHYLVPKLEKVLQLISYPMQQYTMYGVDREKKTQTMAHEKYNITLVPTIILFSGQQEVARITESVNTSIEADLATLIRKNQKQH